MAKIRASLIKPTLMTTDVAAANFPARIHDYRDLPGDEFYRALILFGFAIVLFLSWRFDIFHGVVSAARHHEWGRFVVSPAILWSAMGTLLLLFRTLLWFRYRAAPPASMRDAPTMTVIIPAYNEGAMVARSIESVVHARYPREGAFEVLVVDDGSTDDTWRHIQQRRTPLSRHRHGAALRAQPRRSAPRLKPDSAVVAARSWSRSIRTA